MEAMEKLQIIFPKCFIRDSGRTKFLVECVESFTKWKGHKFENRVVGRSVESFDLVEKRWRNTDLLTFLDNDMVLK